MCAPRRPGPPVMLRACRQPVGTGGITSPRSTSPGRLLAPIDSPQLADSWPASSPSTPWPTPPGLRVRLQTDDGDATAIRPYDDERVMVNMSVWTSVEALKAFVYGDEHRSYLARRRQWFERMDEAMVALWWVPAGHLLPSVDEAKDRLAPLERLGPSPAVHVPHRLPGARDRGRRGSDRGLMTAGRTVGTVRPMSSDARLADALRRLPPVAGRRRCWRSSSAW